MIFFRFLQFNRPLAARRWFRPATMLLAGLMLYGLPESGRAQSNVTATLPSNRWLFVVETSRAMERQSEAVREIVPSLIMTGMGGQFRRGDTIGVWTFNSELHAGQFPLQQWTPETRRNVAQRVAAFLDEQKFERASRIDPVLAEMQSVMRNSDFITIVLISSGEHKIEGTPFDDQINANYVQWRRQQERARLPFVTVLRATRGKITDYVVNTPQFPLQLPPLPTELTTPPPAATPTTAPQIQKTQPPTPAPFILIGKKPEPEPETATNLSASAPRPSEDSPSVSPMNAGSAPSDPRPQAAPAPAPAVTANVNTVPPDASPATGRTMGQLRAAGNTPANTAATSNSPGTTVAPAAEVKPEAAVALAKPSHRFGLWIAVVLAMAAVLLAGLIVALRGRSRAHASLITRSLDREQK